MSIKLQENVRAFIREEIKAALEDTTFLAAVAPYNLHNRLQQMPHDEAQFRRHVKAAMKFIFTNEIF